MADQYLTARSLYRFLTAGAGRADVRVPYLNRRLIAKQSTFWWCFLSSGIPESATLAYFEPRQHPPRALSNLMNRTVPHSMPMKLYSALEEHLTPENLLYMTAWTASVLEKDVNPLYIHAGLTALEEQVLADGSDAEFAELYEFFASLRPSRMDDEPVHLKKLMLWAALRFAMLALHAIYGDRMTASPALARLRTCRFCDITTLWTAISAMVPRANEYSFSIYEATSSDKAQSAASHSPHDDPVAHMASLAGAALPPADVISQHGGDGMGWYVVANWLDIDIYVNDKPMPTYDGARGLGALYNGTLVYVLSAPGYQGLRLSGGIWGKIWWQGAIAWIPMNLMVRIGQSSAADMPANNTQEEPS